MNAAIKTSPHDNQPIEYFRAIDWKNTYPDRWRRIKYFNPELTDEELHEQFAVMNHAIYGPVPIRTTEEDIALKKRAREAAFAGMESFDWDRRKFVRYMRRHGRRPGEGIRKHSLERYWRWFRNRALESA